MSVEVAAGPTSPTGAPKFLFQVSSELTPYEPSLDGARFLFLDPQTRNPSPITIGLNWQASLKK